MSELQRMLKSFGPIKRKAGRPTKLNPVLLDRICQLRGDGCSWREISTELDLNRDTLRMWRRENAGFYHCTENAFRRFQKRELLNGVHRVHA